MKLGSATINLNSTASQDLITDYEGVGGVITGAAIHSFSSTPNAGDANSIVVEHSPTNRPYLTLGLSSISQVSFYRHEPVGGNPPMVANGENVYAKVDTAIGYPCTAVVDILGYEV